MSDAAAAPSADEPPDAADVVADLLLTGIADLATPEGPGPHRGPAQGRLRRVADAAIAVVGGRVAWLGPAAAWRGRAERTVDLGGRAVVPGLVDPHTHLLWGGDRYDDLEARHAGASYEAILARGGGIRHTMRATAGADRGTLVRLARARLASLAASGATTVEVKSGYGGSAAAEIASLEAIAEVASGARVRVVPTLLLHVPEPDARASQLAEFEEHVLPEVARRGLSGRVDVFVEAEAFTASEAERFLRAARLLGLDVTLHADQFHRVGGVELAVRLGARSVDHLEASGPGQIAALAAGDTVATLLPGASLELGGPHAPGRALVDAGVAVAVGSDLNPGSSPVYATSLAVALTLRLNGLRPAEALVAGTANAAAALGLSDAGWLGPGSRADLAVLPDRDARAIVAGLAGPGPVETWIGGVRVAAGEAAGIDADGRAVGHRGATERGPR
jgi:imidazolonepropionase